MTITDFLEQMNQDDVRLWLKEALNGRATLPHATPDEAPHVGIHRAYSNASPMTRLSLRDGSLRLVQDFCNSLQGTTSYIEELMALIVSFQVPEAASLLASLARQFSALPNLSFESRLAVLNALSDLAPQEPSFWSEMLSQSTDYAGAALSGVLRAYPNQALTMLPKLPDTQRFGQMAALKLELAWEDLPTKQRFTLLNGVNNVTQHCAAAVAHALSAWVNSKQAESEWSADTSGANPTLRHALAQLLTDNVPRVHSPKLSVSSQRAA